MNPSPQPITFTLPTHWTPEQACAVHEILDDLLEQIEAHYGMAVQGWLGGEDTDENPLPNTPIDPFETDFDDPLTF